MTDIAHQGLVPCIDEACERSFLNRGIMTDHAEAVHSFDETRRLMHEKIRSTYGREGDHRATPPVSYIWTYVEELAVDWVVFQIEDGNESALFKVSYSLVDGEITLGQPVEVRRRVVFEPVRKES